MDANGLQLSSHIHNVSSSLNDMGQRVGLLARQEATIAKAYERVTQGRAEIRRVTAPPEQVTTLQRVVNGLEPEVGTLEGQYQTLKLRQTKVMEQLDRTASLLDERTITIQATTSRLNYCEQTLQTALNRITILGKGTGASTESLPLSNPMTLLLLSRALAETGAAPGVHLRCLRWRTPIKPLNTKWPG